MKHIKLFREATSYHTLNDGDEYDINKTVRDSGHDYEYCDGILYELSGNDTVVGIDEVEGTEGNLFYSDQVTRYVQYFEEGGICQTFPVMSSPLGGCRSLSDMLDYLDESDSFDLAWDILSKDHRKLFDMSKWEITTDAPMFGFNDEDEIGNIRTIEDLDLCYNSEIMDDEDREGDYDEELYNGFVAIMDYWKDAEEYTLTDFNHRYLALKEMGKTTIMVDPS